MEMVQCPTDGLTVCHHQLKTVQTIKVCRIEHAFHHSMYRNRGDTESAATMGGGNHHISSGFRICVVNQNPKNISLCHSAHAWTTREESFHRSWFRSWISRRIAMLSNCSSYPG